MAEKHDDDIAPNQQASAQKQLHNERLVERNSIIEREKAREPRESEEESDTGGAEQFAGATIGISAQDEEDEVSGKDAESRVSQRLNEMRRIRKAQKVAKGAQKAKKAIATGKKIFQFGRAILLLLSSEVLLVILGIILAAAFISIVWHYWPEASSAIQSVAS